MVCWERKIASIIPIVFLSSFSVLFSCKKQADTLLPYYNTPEFYPVFISDVHEIASKVPHQISDFSFTNQNNQTVTQKHIEGKVHVANFIFTSCGSICPKMTNHMKMVSDAFRNDNEVLLLSYSVTPWIDSVARLKTYAEENDIDSRNWHLLTGNKTKILLCGRRRGIHKRQR